MGKSIGSSVDAFTLDDAVESMEHESLDVGITSVLEALDHATGTLHDVVYSLWAGIVWPCFLPFSSSIYFLYPDHRLSIVPYSS